MSNHECRYKKCPASGINLSFVISHSRQQAGIRAGGAGKSATHRIITSTGRYFVIHKSLIDIRNSSSVKTECECRTLNADMRSALYQT
jgi:hypothetical protein